jgi:hypothetical protein
MRTLASLLLVALALVACGAPASQAPAAAPAPAVAAAPARSADSAAERFAAAYRHIFCKANYGYDPDGTMEALKEPMAVMKQLQKMGSDRLPLYLQILSDNGFSSLGEFDQKAAELRADKEWWAALENGLMNDLAHCQ